MAGHTLKWFREYAENADMLKPLTRIEWKELADILRDLDKRDTLPEPGSIQYMGRMGGNMKIEPLKERETAMTDDQLYKAWAEAESKIGNETDGAEAQVEAALRKALLNRLSMYGTVMVSSDKPLPPVTRRPG